MQPAIEQQIKTTGQLPGKFTPMGVSQKDIAHIMGVLTEQYSDPARAALTEIAANARDSHVMAGKGDVPIRITLPNVMCTDLIIEDEGVGMSVEFMEKRFSQYGDSDKRDEAEGIGGFGIGGKAPLAYTDSYTIITVKDHEEAMFVVSRDASGAAGITRVFVRATDAGNGTRVKIPSVNIDDFTDRAEWLFKFWPEGSVLVNGEAPRRHGGTKVGDNIWYNQNASQSYIVMGGMPYRISNPSRFLRNSYLGRFHYIAEVPINSADITPSREDLKYTPKTDALLHKIGDDFAEAFKKMISDEISNSPTAHEAFDKWMEWINLVGRDNVTITEYKGNVFADHVELDGYRWKRDAYRYQTNNNHCTTATVKEARTALFITGRDDLSSYTKSRVRLWMDDSAGTYSSVVYFVKDVPTSPWVKQFKHATWQDIISVKPERSTQAADT